MTGTHFTPLSPERHRTLKLASDDSFQHSRRTPVVSLAFGEITAIAGCMPVVVLEGAAGQDAVLCALLSFDKETNLFCSGDGWEGHVAPLQLTLYPFSYQQSREGITLTADLESELFSEGTAPLFSPDGGPMPALKSRQQTAAELAHGRALSAQFVTWLSENNLLAPLTVTITLAGGEKQTLEGLKTISEQAFENLSDKTLAELHHSGMLMAIHAMILSLRQFNRLVQLSRKTEMSVTSVSLSVD